MNRRIMVQASPDKNEGPIPKINKAKRAGSMAEVVDHLPSKHDTLNPNQSTIKREKKI
jgi:hypothetical protein